MKKSYFFKFFVFALVGALAILPSCKDYDDDISGLETSVSTVKSDLTALQSSVTTAQSAATAAQSTATDALAKANEALAAAQAAGDAEAIAALETQVEGLVAQIADINEELEALAGLEARVEALMAELEAANEAQLEAIIADVAGMSEELQGMVGDMVTAVKLIGASPALKFSTIKEKENVFAEGIANAITFVKDKEIQSLQTLVIQVSPANAEITPEMVTLQNSKGIAYDNIDIVSVKPYDKILTRSTDGSGLWEVTVRLKEYVVKDFLAATETADKKKVLFAVAINNTTTEANPLIRKVTTDYDVTLESGTAPVMKNVLNYFVNDKHVSTINNRYGVTGGVAEYAWSGAAAVKVIKPEDTGANTKHDNPGDNRIGEDLYPAVQGKAIKIALTDKVSEIAKPANVRAIYVTLDKGNAVESAPSELNAWNSYTYTGLNTVVEGTETTITVDGATAINDIIGFRVYAVNVDGTLVDPDGKAFYVKVGKDATDWNALNTVITATDDAAIVTSIQSAKVNATLTKLDGATKYEWTTDKADDAIKTPLAFNIHLVAKADGTSTTDFATTGTSGVINSGVDFSKVTKAYAVPTVNSWLAYTDNKVYNGKLVIKNASDHILATLDVTFKKELPTTMEGFSVKTSQLSDGVWNAYLIPNTTGVNWTTPTYAATGKMLLSNVFNFGTTDAAKLLRFETTFAASSISGTKTVALTTKGTGPLEVAKSFIDNETEHATEVKYNFGKISTETKDASGPVDYKVSLATMKTVYNNIYNSTYTWNWATREQLDVLSASNDFTEKNAAGEYVKALPYSDKVTYNSAKEINLYHIYGVSTKDETAYNAPLRNPFKISGIPSLKVMSATFVSANGVQEYFTAAVATDGTKITLTPVSATSNPTADVPTTLKIVAKDIYGNDVKIDFPMTVKPS